MWFAIGYVAGIATSALIGAVAVYFRRPITRAVATAERAIRRLDPAERGFIIEAEDDAEIARKEHIERNKKAGRDTPINELL